MTQLTQRDRFLLLVRDDVLAANLCRRVQRFGLANRGTTVDEALALFSQREHWAGLIVDVDALGSEPLAALERLRAAQPLTPILMLASRLTPLLLNESHRMRAELVAKPLQPSNLVGFIRRSVVAGWLPDDRVSAYVDDLACTMRLTPREVQLVAYALGNEARPDVMRRLGISENTLKTQVRRMLRKCRARSMDAFARNVLRDALVFQTEPAWQTPADAWLPAQPASA